MNRRSPNDPFLPPIEEPKDPMLKQLYATYESRFGKAMLPLKVHNARLPASFAQFYGKINELDRELTLPPQTIQLIRHRVSQINVCSWCMDAELAFVILGSGNQAKFDNVNEYRTSHLFNDAERAALDYTSELAKDRRVSPENDDATQYG